MRTIRNDSPADEALTAALERWGEGADDAWEAITWLIARDPYIGTALSEAGNVRAYSLEGARSKEWPTLTVVYKIEDDETITIKEARFEVAKAPKAGHA